jgi:hypothetical protein
LRGKTRVARLSDGGVEGIEDADVLMLAGEALEAGVHFPRVLLGKLGDGTDAEAIEVAEHGGTDGDQVVQAAFIAHGSTFLFRFTFAIGLRRLYCIPAVPLKRFL